MRIHLISESGDGAWFVIPLAQEGHEVSWSVKNKPYAEVLKGFIPAPIDEVDPAEVDLVVLDQSGMGRAADAARKVTPVIGGSVFADKLEEDRIYGLEVMEQSGIKVPPWEAFDSPDKGIAFLRKNPKRYVFKPCDSEDSACTYVSKSAEDLELYFERLFKKSKIQQYVLQEYVSGTEVSTNAWFNGEEFFALDHTLEEKKYLAGGLGANTGCAGNVVWMPLRPNALFQRGLEKVSPVLRENQFVGPIDLNAIVTDGELYGVEWTPRFGYEGTCNIVPLLSMPFGEFLYKMAVGDSPTMGVPKHRFAATIRISVPPYPMSEKSLNEKYAGIPVQGLDVSHLENIWLCNVRQGEDGPETIGLDQPIGAPIGTGDSMGEAFEACKELIRQLQVPDLAWRNDVSGCCQKRYETLQSQGWLRPIGV